MRSNNRLFFLYGLLVMMIVAAATLLYMGWEPKFGREEPSVPTVPSSSLPTSITSVVPSFPMSSIATADDSQLKLAVIGFVKAFYLRQPDDDAASYTSRLEAYASSEFLSQLDLGVFEREPFLSISAENASVEAVLAKDDVVVVFDGSAPGMAWVEIELELKQSWPDGRTGIIRRDIFQAMLWRLTDAGWRVYPAPPG